MVATLHPEGKTPSSQILLYKAKRNEIASSPKCRNIAYGMLSGPGEAFQDACRASFKTCLARALARRQFSKRVGSPRLRRRREKAVHFSHTAVVQTGDHQGTGRLGK
ncbi:hypothetical protein Pcinc_010698 [Petrolisthes cinctipes]|uniref:Uncharacterized protein n=1 Tax=Petrolisthes cinctipes TaxID=88211 RepID=A0AAE1G2B2_PETCI|nr:hypothetical protein Pcinc_010698 [Petrolisthes cinctipes]